MFHLFSHIDSKIQKDSDISSFLLLLFKYSSLDVESELILHSYYCIDSNPNLPLKQSFFTVIILASISAIPFCCDYSSFTLDSKRSLKLQANEKPFLTFEI